MSNIDDESSMTPTTSRIKTNPSNDITFMEKVIDQRADDLYESLYKFCEKWRAMTLNCPTTIDIFVDDIYDVTCKEVSDTAIADNILPKWRAASRICLRWKKRATDDLANTPTTSRLETNSSDDLVENIIIELIENSLESYQKLRSDISTNHPNNTTFVKEVVDKFADELYDLARKNWWHKPIGGTVVVFMSDNDDNDSDNEPSTRPYMPGVLKKLFTSERPYHVGPVPFYLREGLIETFLELFDPEGPMTFHRCQPCENRGIRHVYACELRYFTSAPIIVISEKKGQVSLFWKHRVQFNIGKEDLKKELLNAYEQERNSSIHERLEPLMDPITSGIKPNPSNDLIFVEELVGQRADLFDDLYGVCEKWRQVSGLELEMPATYNNNSMAPATITRLVPLSGPKLEMPATCNKISMTPTTSVTKTNSSKGITFVKDLISQLADDLYYLARNKIGGTVIINHFSEDTADWQETMQTCISRRRCNHRYESGFFKEIFTSKGPEHDGAVIFCLRNSCVDSFSTKLPMTKHNCEHCANRGTRHASACYFSNFAAVPVIVVSEEKSQVSLYRDGRAQFDIDKEYLNNELLNAHMQEVLWFTFTSRLLHTFDDYLRYFGLKPFIPNADGYEWFFRCYRKNFMDLHRGTTFTIGECQITVTPENPTHYALAEKYIECKAQMVLDSYKKNEKECAILSYGNKKLGGLLYNITGCTIVLSQLFLPRQFLKDGFAVSFLRELCKIMFPGCDRIEFFVPPYLTGRYAKVIEAINGTEVPSLLVKHHLDPIYNVGFVGNL